MIFPLLAHNPVMAAKYQALAAAAEDAAAASAARAQPGSARAAQARRAVRSARAKARVACAASLLRWIYFMAVHDAGGTRWPPPAAAGPLQRLRRPPDQGQTRHAVKPAP